MDFAYIRNLVKFETGSLREGASVQKRCSTYSTEPAGKEYSTKRHRSPKVNNFHPHSEELLIPHKSANLESQHRAVIRSPSPAWSTFAKTSMTRTRNTTFEGHSSIPKLGDRFRMPMRLFPENLPPAHFSPPAFKLPTPKVTLFTPSQPHYIVHTARGSQYGPLVQARQDGQPRASRLTSGSAHTKTDATGKGFPLRKGQTLSAPHQAHRQQEREADWLQAWKRPSDQPRYGYQGPISISNEFNVASEGFPTFRSFNQASERAVAF